MRWLFALLIAVSCWANAVSGELLLPVHPLSTGMSLSALSQSSPDCDSSSHSTLSFSSFPPYLNLQNQAAHPQLRLLGVPVKKTAIKNRLGATKFTGLVNPSSANSTWPWPAAYHGMFHTHRADEIYKQPRQSQPLLNYSNWIFHASTQQNRVGGWKESNIQYSGMLTYHHDGVMSSMLLSC
ncbi:putative lipoprotein [Yersinia aldovae]|uniref:hypothetical protein n=1 Tax=Yersinia aldovae TaxID=29483 RepID=UPI0005E071EB|nr:hypothetical protein [Yersinia aldovae]CNI01747.1 putative lipoprotein [Yersinia aldovae]